MTSVRAVLVAAIFASLVGCGGGSGSTPVAPIISIDTSSVIFSNQPVNVSSAAQALAVRNSGPGTLTVSGVTLGGSDASQFAQTNNCSSVVAGGSCTITVTFKPTSAGAKSATLSIASNASGSPSTVALSGTGLASSALPFIVNLDAVRNATTDTSGSTFGGGATAVRVNLPAGTYVLTPIGILAGGQFTAVEFCICNTNPRKYAYIYDYVTSEQSSRVRVAATSGTMDSGMNYSTPEAALAGAPVQRVTLTQSGWISFFIYDTPISDNAGGVSLRITDASTANR